LNNLPAKRPGPREAGKQSGRSFVTATLCFTGQGVLFDLGAKEVMRPMFDQIYVMRQKLMVIRRTVLRLVGFPYECRRQKKRRRS
jgi:hypothetical protein